jgi:hypothetical protein
VALGRTYLLPPLSSGGALVVQPWLRFHIPLIGRVEGWRAVVARGSRPTPRLSLRAKSGPVRDADRRAFWRNALPGIEKIG